MGNDREILLGLLREARESVHSLTGFMHNHCYSLDAVADEESLRDRIDAVLAKSDDPDAPHIWVQRFCDLVGQDGLTENSRNEAFAKLYDAVKAAKRVSNE